MYTGAKVIIGITLVALLAGGAYWYFSPSDLNVGIEFSKPPQAALGEPFIVSILVSNYSDTILVNASLSLMLPEGVSFVGQDAGQRVMEQTIGDVGPGSVSREDFTVIALKDADSLKQFKAKLRYKAGVSSKTQFETSAETAVAIGRPALQLTFSAPEKVFNGEKFDIVLKYQNDSTKDYHDLVIRMAYPPAFQFEKADPEPVDKRGEWEIPSLGRGGKGSITISGAAIGPEGSFLNFTGAFAAAFQGRSYEVNSQNATIAIASSPLSLSLLLNNKEDYLTHTGDNLTYTLRYKNNANTALANVTVRAALTGTMFDFPTVQTNATFNSVTNTLLWNAANAPGLIALGAGEEGSVSFSIRTKGGFPLVRAGDKNYVLRVQAQAESPTVPAGAAAEKTIALAKIETKVKGEVKLAAKGYFRDAGSGIVNKGPYPPKVNQPTQYTIHWAVTNYGTDVSDVTLKAFLKSGARLTGVIKSNTDSKPTWNPASGEVIWNIKSITAGKGVISAPLEAIFQVEQTPAITQVGRPVTLLGPTELQATDDFTGETLAASVGEIDTTLPDDPTLTGSDRGVQE